MIDETRVEKVYTEVCEYLEDMFAKKIEEWESQGKILLRPELFFEDYFKSCKDNVDESWGPYHGLWMATMAMQVFWGCMRMGDIKKKAVAKWQERYSEML